MTDRRRICLESAIVCCCALLPDARSALGQPPNNVTPQVTPELVSENLIPQRTRGMLPMDRGDFERRLLASDSQPTSPELRRILRAVYCARYHEGRLIDGHGEWLTDRPEGAAPSAIPQHRLPIERVVNTAVDVESRDVLPVTRPPSLIEFRWTLAPLDDRTALAEFLCQLPSCPINQLVVWLPDGFRVDSALGVVSRFDSEQASDAVRRVVDSAEPAEHELPWLIELGGQSSIALSISAASSASRSSRLKQVLQYRLSEQGIELQARLTLRVTTDESQLILDVDRPLRIAAARLGDLQLNVLEPGGSDQVILEFPDGLSIGQRDVEISAIAPLQLESLFRLPAFRVANAIWQQGTTTLHIPAELELERLEHQGYLATAVSPLPSPQRGESRELQAYRHDAAIRVQLARREPKVDVQTAVSLRMSDLVVTARQVSLATADPGEKFTLKLLSPEGWVVDSMETVPPEALEGLVTVGEGERTHRLSLRQPVNSQRSLQIEIQAHRPIQDGRLDASELRPIRFADEGSERRFVALSADSNHQIQLIQDAALKRFLLEDVPADLAPYLELSAASILYQDDLQRSSFGIQVERRPPRYSARIDVEAIIDAGVLHQQFRVRCEPEDSPISTIRLRITPSTAAPIEWRIDGDADGLVPARSLEAEVGAGHEDLEIVLRNPVTEPITLIGELEATFSPANNISLLSATWAASQSASLMIASADGQAFSVEESRLKPTIGPAIVSESAPAVRSYFDYFPTQTGAVRVIPILDGAPDAIWVWQCQLHSWFDRSGFAVHHATLDVQNLGVRQATIRFPVGVRIKRAAINGEELPLTSSVLQRHSIDISLPRDRAASTIQIEYGSDARSLGAVATVETPWPDLDIPCLQRTWRVWLPPGYEPFRSLPEMHRHELDLTWDQRLLGAGAFGIRDAPFNSFSLADWRQVLLGSSQSTASPPRFLSDFHDASAEWSPTTFSGIDGRPPQRGWSNVDIDLDDDQAAELSIVQVSVMRGVGWGLSLFTIGAVVWSFAKRRRWLPYLIIVAAGATLLVPSDWLFLVRGVFFGVLIGSMFLVFDRRRKISGELVAQVAKVQRVSLLLLFAALILSPEESRGQRIVPANSPSTTKEEVVDEPRAIIPVDDTYQPIGDVIYVTPDLYDQLNRSSSAAGLRIESARYQATLVHRGDTSALQLTELIATYQLTANLRGTKLVLPLQLDELTAIEATLDGRFIEPVWNQDHYSFELPAAGRLELVCRLTPRIERFGEFSRIRLRIPEVSDSKLTLRTPRSSPPVDILRCLGAQFLTRRDARLADLGPVDQLDMRWANPSSSQRATVDADILSWWEVRASSTILDLHCRFRAAEGELSKLHFNVDEQLVLRDILVDGLPATYQPVAGESERVEVELPRKYVPGETGNIRATLHLPGFGSLGRIELPEVSVQGAAVRSAWFAVSLPDHLEAELSGESEVQRVGELEFAVAWPIASHVPRIACRVAAAGGPLELAIRPQQTEMQYQQEMVLAVGQHTAEVHTQIAVEVTAGHVLQQRIELPRDLQLDTVAVTQAETNRLFRWSTRDSAHDGTRILTLFYSEPIEGSFAIVIGGSLPVAVGNGLAVPAIRCEQSLAGLQTIHLFRRPGTDLAMRGELLQMTLPEWCDQFAGGRYLGSLTGAGLPNESISILSNEPRLAASLVTELNYQQEQWMVQVELTARVEEGVVDAFRLRVPSDWETPLDVEPAMECVLTAVAGIGGKVLTMRPPAAVNSKFEARLRAPLPNPQDQDLRVPDIALMDIAEVDRSVILPTQIDNQKLEWRHDGLVSPTELGDARIQYRVDSSSVQASLLDTYRDTRASVHLADYYLSFQRDGSCRGVASFDIEQARLSDCRLSLPAGYELLQVTVGELPATLSLQGPRLWQIRLASDQLPQRVTVLFTGRLRRGPLGGQVLTGPSLEGFLVKQTLWTIESADESLRPLLQHTQVSAAEQVAIRLATVRDLVQLSRTDVAARNEFDWWRQRWARREDRYLAQLQASTTGPPDSAQDLVEMWRQRLRHGAFLHCVVRGPAETFVVKRSNWKWRRLSLSLGMIGAVFAFAGLAWVYFRTSFCREWLLRWPHAVGVLAGIVLWLTVVPSFIGWCIVLLFSLSSLRPIWGRFSVS